MVELAMSMIAFGPAVIGPGMNTNDHGYNAGRQFIGMKTTLEKTGSISKTAEAAAKDTITLAEEFFQQQTIIPYEYEIVNGKWTSGGKTLDELGIGERVERIIRAQDGMAQHSSITQALTVSEDTGSGRSYIYLFSKDKDDKNKISALAIEYNGTTNELATLLKNLSGHSQDFTQPLFVNEEREISIKNFFRAAFDSFGTEERRSQVNSYLKRLDRDVSDFPALVFEHQKRVTELARKIEEDLLSDPDLVSGLACAVNGLNRVVEAWISQEGDVYYQRLGEQSSPIVTESRQVFYETRTPIVDYSSVTPVPALETTSNEVLDATVGLFVQTLIKSINEENEEGIVNIIGASEEKAKVSETELSAEMITDVIEPIVPIMEVILQQLIEMDLEETLHKDGVYEVTPLSESTLVEDPENFMQRLVLLMLAPPQNQDVESRVEIRTSFETPDVTPQPFTRFLSRPSRSRNDTENVAAGRIQQVLEMVLIEWKKEEAADEVYLEKSKEIKAIADSLVEFFIKDQGIEGILFDEEDESLTNIKLLLEVYDAEETAEDIKELVVLFLFHELVKVYPVPFLTTALGNRVSDRRSRLSATYFRDFIALYRKWCGVYENKELKDKYPELSVIFARFELIFQDPIFTKRYENFILCVEKLFSSELLNDDGWKDFSLIELIEMIKVKQYGNKSWSFPRNGIIYQYLCQVVPSEL